MIGRRGRSLGLVQRFYNGLLYILNRDFHDLFGQLDNS